jgi:hypothetical protein
MNAKTHVTGDHIAWSYTKPLHGGAKSLLLTIGGILITGNWHGEVGEHFLAWAPMPRRDKALEAELLAVGRARRLQAKAAQKVSCVTEGS